MSNISILILSSLFLNYANSLNPQHCFLSSADLNTLVKCLQQFIAKKESISDKTWQTVVPTPNQRESWKRIVRNLLESNGNCDQVSIPAELNLIYKITKFTDRTTKTYCVLHEIEIVQERFAKGWGVFMVPYFAGSAQNSVHISAAHPLSDGPVHIQATNVFQRTNSRSLLIQCQDRFASVVPSSCEKGYMRTDGAHDNNTMFHSANLAIMEWQMGRPGGCKTDKCSFIQFHGKAADACPSSTIFLSTGPGDSLTSIGYYKNSQLPVRLLRANLQQIFPQDITVNTPLEDNKCHLTAGSNIFGRVLNGVTIGNECKNEANVANVKGYFIHAEQSMVAREPKAYDVWSQAITKTFG